MFSRNIVRPSQGEICRRPNEKDEVFLGAGSLNLLIELEGLAGKVSPHVEQYETVQTRLPQKSRRAEAVGGLGHADAATAMKYQHPGLEQIRIAVDERNREHAELARSQESPHNSPHNPEWVQ